MAAHLDQPSDKLQAFLSSIEDEELIQALVDRPPGIFQKRHLDSLQKIGKHFAKVTGRSTPASRRDKRHAFRSLLNLTTLQPCIDAAAFVAADFDPADYLSRGTIDARVTSSGNDADDFIARYSYTLQLAHQQQEHRLRWCFMMLGYFDLVRRICPHRSAKMVGKLMMEDVRRFVGELAPEAEQMEELLQNLNTWSNLGSKLDELCTAFKGEGCLIFLARVLSEDFLGEKYRRTGPQHDEAFTHLDALGLAEEAERSGANAFGAKMRAHFMEPYS